ncbi:MAG TPA: pyridoxal-phosphate dependent enzyme [Candidatus Limnocylindrales bacterium]|nr:pyridoxal-phosphate dependent enzyme [Candidatus Limnocylindrales bacterium]
MASPPRFPLFDRPSPLQPLPRFCDALGGRAEIWIKREDLLPLAFGGNKLRNLEFLVGAALAEGADTLITSGRRWSNHARLTAAAGARAGLVVHLVLSGPPVDPPGPGVRLARAFGATVHQLATADRDEREAKVAEISADVAAGGGRPYVIGVGGTGAVGAYGQLLAAEEVVAQADELALGIDRVVLATATGGTQAGLVAGLRPATKVTGMVVARTADELRPVIARTAAELGALVGAAEIDLDERFIGAGYGRPTEAAQEAADLLARTEAILVDPIYTAKALAGLTAGVRSGAWEGERIVFWHAGGLPGLFEPLDA